MHASLEIVHERGHPRRRKWRTEEERKRAEAQRQRQVAQRISSLVAQVRPTEGFRLCAEYMQADGRRPAAPRTLDPALLPPRSHRALVCATRRIWLRR